MSGSCTGGESLPPHTGHTEQQSSAQVFSCWTASPQWCHPRQQPAAQVPLSSLQVSSAQMLSDWPPLAFSSPHNLRGQPSWAARPCHPHPPAQVAAFGLPYASLSLHAQCPPLQHACACRSRDPWTCVICLSVAWARAQRTPEFASTPACPAAKPSWGEQPPERADHTSVHRMPDELLRSERL